jgi:hypothetical protein
VPNAKAVPFLFFSFENGSLSQRSESAELEEERRRRVWMVG